MKYKYELSVDEFFDAENGLLAANFDELESYQKDFPLDPDREKYRMIQSLGIIKNIALFDNDEMVGYCIFIVIPHLHNKKAIVADVDVLYLKPEYRKGGVGLDFVREIERYAASFNVDVLIHRVKQNTPALKFILEKTGYSELETLLSKKLRR